MDAEKMTPDELMELAREKQGAEPPTTREVTVRGHTFNVDDRRLTSWKAFKLVASLDDEKSSGFGKVQAAIELMEFITDLDADAVVESLGGDMANPVEVMQVVTEIVAGAYPKN